MEQNKLQKPELFINPVQLVTGKTNRTLYEKKKTNQTNPQNKSPCVFIQLFSANNAGVRLYKTRLLRYVNGSCLDCLCTCLSLVNHFLCPCYIFFSNHDINYCCRWQKKKYFLSFDREFEVLMEKDSAPAAMATYQHAHLIKYGTMINLYCSLPKSNGFSV